MILWEVKENGNLDLEFEVGPITVLKGSNSLWFQLVRLIEDYFTNKGSKISIMEDTQPINKNDWECLFIPFDAHLSLDKISSKSPLKFLMDEALDELYYNVMFRELNEIWIDLREEIEIISKRKVEKYGIKLTVEDFSLDHLKKFICFLPLKKIITPYDFKKMILKLFANKPLEKKRLAIIEYPELYTNGSQFQEIVEYIKLLSSKGLWFIIVTQQSIPFNCNVNYVVQDVVINEARIELIKKKVLNELPFVIDQNQFLEIKKRFLKLVDNLTSQSNINNLSTDYDDVTLAVFYVLSSYLGISLSIDKSRFSGNLAKFIQSFK